MFTPPAAPCVPDCGRLTDVRKPTFSICICEVARDLTGFCGEEWNIKWQPKGSTMLDQDTYFCCPIRTMSISMFHELLIVDGGYLHCLLAYVKGNISFSPDSSSRRDPGSCRVSIMFPLHIFPQLPAKYLLQRPFRALNDRTSKIPLCWNIYFRPKDNLLPTNWVLAVTPGQQEDQW